MKNKEQLLSPEEIAVIEGERTMSDAELLKGGAKYVDCTLLGIGERAGNCGLSRFLQAAEGTYEMGVSRRKATIAEEQLRSVLSGII